MLRDLNLKGVYRSESDNLLEDFYLPALKESCAFDRAVGFFSAAMISYAAQGVSALVERGGKMRLIFGGELDESEERAIRDGYDLRSLSARVGAQVVGAIDNLGDALTRNRLEALSWLVAAGHLDIKFALKRRGMYHEKMGVFRDESGDQIVFQGSANETVYALLPDFNFESVSVYPCWRAEFKEYYIPFIEGFERLWGNQSPDTVVLDFPEAARERLITIAKRAKTPTSEIEKELWDRLNRKALTAKEPAGPRVPATLGSDAFSLRPHQTQALHAWRAQDLQGILEMATGSGKTLTAIYGLVRVFESLRKGGLFCVVGVPYQSLADQWIDALDDFEIRAIPCYASRATWEPLLSRAITLFQMGVTRFTACVVVNRTLQSATFQSMLAQVPGDSLAFIGDECHHYGAEALAGALPRSARLRLGLSATPEHYFNDEATSRVSEYFGQVAFRYSLADALRDGVLTPYRYYPHFVELNDEEAQEYAELSARISKLAAGRGAEHIDSAPDQALKLLLFKRSRLLANAESKIELLDQLLKKSAPTPYHLFYCGDGSVEGDIEESPPARQVDLVSDVLHANGWKVSHFTARETREERHAILERFTIGALDGLVAIRCLDEGIDVPDCRVAYFLASSRNPRQFIQRRGRILRRSPGKDYAIVNDFVVALPDGVASKYELERSLMKSELARISEFAALSMNRSEAYTRLEPYLDAYDLHHHFL